MKNQKNLKIFYVDDEPFTLRLSQGVLNNLDYTDVTIFDSGEACLAKINENPNIVFLDYQMKGMNGVEVLTEIKKRNSTIYVVMISTQDNVQIMDKTIDLGAFSFLRKEGDVNDMLTTIMEKIGPRVASIQNFLSLTSKSYRPISFKNL